MLAKCLAGAGSRTARSASAGNHLSLNWISRWWEGALGICVALPTLSRYLGLPNVTIAMVSKILSVYAAHATALSLICCTHVCSNVQHRSFREQNLLLPEFPSVVPARSSARWDVQGERNYRVQGFREANPLIFYFQGGILVNKLTTESVPKQQEMHFTGKGSIC